MELLLKKNEILDLGKQLKGLSIVCLEGRCWITQAHDNRDHILYTDYRHNCTADGLLLVTALDDCRLKLVAPKTNKAASSWKQLIWSS